MQDLYLTEESKKEIIKILTEEYEKILISETISKSNRSTIEKQQIAEIVDYLQNNQNITYADLYNLNESWRKILGKIAGKIGRRVLGPAGTVLDVLDAGTQAYEFYKELTKPRPQPPPPYPLPGGGSIPAQGVPVPGIGQVFQGGGLRETTIKIPENLPESMKALEIVNYLQNSENVTYADLIELCEARKAGWGLLRKIGDWIGVGGAEEIATPLTPMTLDPIGIIPDPFVGPGGQFERPGRGWPTWHGWNPAEDGYPAPEEREPDFVGPPYYGPGDPANQPPENLPESMKAFWKNRLLEKINHK